MPATQLIRILTVPFVVIGSVLLLYLIDDGLGIGWPQNVVRNWEEFGFLNLGGKLVINSGGFDIANHPETYKGMSPISLYPAYFATKFFSWTGLGTMSYHILLALAVFWAIWNILGRDNLAFITAALTILLPGYLRWQKMLDPNTVPVLLALPYAAIVVSILKRPQLSFAAIFGICALTFGFTALNWSTAWVYGPLTLVLWFLPSINRHRTIVFIALAGISCTVLLISSVIIKTGNDQSSEGASNLAQFFLGYTWGNVGYGLNLTTSTAALRLAFVNGVALLPLLLLFGYFFRRHVRGGQMLWPSISPLLLAVLQVGVMRNYFAMHPWMAAPLLLVGLVFSMSLARGLEENTEFTTYHLANDCSVGRRNIGVLLLCFVYGLSVILFLRANERNTLALVNLIRHATERSDIVIVPQDIDQETTLLAPRLPEMLDRNVTIANEVRNLSLREIGVVVLSTKPLVMGVAADRFTLLGQTYRSERLSYLWAISDWFNKSISRRQPGDRLEVAARYFLYRASSDSEIK